MRMHSSRSTISVPRWFLVTLALLVLVIVFAVASTRYRSVTNTVRLMTAQAEQFPDIDQTKLTVHQRTVVEIIKQEWQSQPAGTKYAQGVVEPWCADFVSWVLREVKTPLVNPHSGSWRVPGTHTLRETFISRGVWHDANSDYTPVVGDVAIYSQDGTFGEHTNFVMDYRDDKVTTVGGNEAGKIHVQVHKTSENLGLLGYAEISKL